jgi:hypothetical protein
MFGGGFGLPSAALGCSYGGGDEGCCPDRATIPVAVGCLVPFITGFVLMFLAENTSNTLFYVGLGLNLGAIASFGVFACCCMKDS